jgi:hypothetical protein
MNFNEEKTKEAKAAGVVKSADEVLNWGRSGQTELTPERNAARIPESAVPATGVYPEPQSTTSTMPSDFGRRAEPDRDNNRAWNASEIFGNTKIGGAQ